MIGGYTGKILKVNLSKADYKIEKLDKKDASKFIGGKGLGGKMLWDLSKPGMDPLSPANPLIFITGPLTGTQFPTSGRFVICTKSPLTGIWLDSQIGGYFGPALKQAGFDAMILEGKSQNPVYLLIEDENLEIKEAGWLWGKTTTQTVKLLRETNSSSKLRVASIGHAGEKLVRYACINIDTHEQRERGGQAGRGGAGAVMGSKLVKAIGIKPKKERVIELAEPQKFKEYARLAMKKIRENSFIPTRRKFGTPYWINPVNESGILPTRNFSHAYFPEAEKISGERMRETLVIKDKACFNCPIMCGKQSKTEDKRGIFELEGPEYETLALMGSNCGISALETIARGSLLADELGLDTISLGNVIGFAMECGEKGLIPANELKGLSELKFGSEPAFFWLIDKISRREGIGNLLAEGVRKSSQQIGKGSADFAMETKGMEFPGYEPRGSWGMALAYATSDRGACHQRAWTVTAETGGKLGERFSPEGRAKFVKETQDERAIAFSLVVCDFAPLEVKDFVSLLNLATGFELDEKAYLEIGERIWNLTRMYSVREGISRKDDRLPKRLEEPLPDGPTKGIKISKEVFDQMLDEYYELRGWDENGIPTQAKLSELGLGECL
jgi:aldehyde:ferredoxin oxidoreductase